MATNLSVYMPLTTMLVCSSQGECLSTYRIKDGDFESWHTEWLKTAQKVHKYADESLSLGHKTSAREAYLRATTYYRVTEFFLIDLADPRIQTTWGSSKQRFSEAAKLSSPAFEPLKIPYKGTSLPGYFYKVDEKAKSMRPRPVLIAHGGFDSTLEELYTEFASLYASIWNPSSYLITSANEDSPNILD